MSEPNVFTYVDKHGVIIHELIFSECMHIKISAEAFTEFCKVVFKNEVLARKNLSLLAQGK